MADFIDKVVSGNPVTARVSGGLGQASTDSEGAFQAVLGDLVLESSAQVPTETMSSAESHVDLSGVTTDGNNLPSQDQNLPPDSLASEAVANSSSSAEAVVPAEVKATAASELRLDPEVAAQSASMQDRRFGGELGELIRLIDNEGVAGSRLQPSQSGQSPVDTAFANRLASKATNDLLPEAGNNVQKPTVTMTSAKLDEQLLQLSPTDKLRQLDGLEKSASRPTATPAALPSTAVNLAQSNVGNAQEPTVTMTSAKFDEQLLQLAQSDKSMQLERLDKFVAPGALRAAATESLQAASLPTAATTNPVGQLSQLNLGVATESMTRGQIMTAPGDTEGFSSSLVTHLRVMKAGGANEARLQLNPAELGRLSIQIASQDNEVTVSFVVESSQAKQAVEAAMPRLRELLDQAGLDLAESGVSQRDQDSQDAPSGSSHQRDEQTEEPRDSSAVTMAVIVDPSRLVDAYA